MAEMSGNQLFIIAIVGLIISSITTSIISPIVVWMVSKEQRRRDLEDRKMVADAAKEAAIQAQVAASNARDAARAVLKVSLDNSSALKKTGALMSDVKGLTDVTLVKLDAVHEDVCIIGEKADLSYKEANVANLKIQALQDVMAGAMGVDQKNITNATLTNEEKKEE